MLTPTLNLPTITQEIALNTIRFNRNLGNVQSRIAMFGRRMADIGIGLSLAIAIPLQLMAAGAIKAFADLEHAATRAASRIAGSTRATVGNIIAFSNILARRIPIAQAEIARGVEELVKVGASEGFAMRAVEKAAKFAVAGGVELNVAVHDLMGTMSAFGLTTGKAAEDLATLAHVSDVIAFAADETLASYTSLVEAFEKAAPSAKGLGISFEETAAIMATMSQAMIEGGTAGTKFGMISRDLTRTSIKHAAAWKRVGERVGVAVNVFDPATGNMRQMADIIGELELALSKYNDQAKITAIMELGIPFRSLHATLAMFGLSEQAKELQESFMTAGDYIDSVFQKQMQSFTNQMILLKNQFREVGFDIGRVMAPALLDAGGVVQRMIVWWRGLTDAQKQTIVSWGAMTVAVSLLLIPLGMLIRTVALLIIGIYRLAEALTVLAYRMIVLVYPAFSATINLFAAFTIGLLQAAGAAAVFFGTLAIGSIAPILAGVSAMATWFLVLGTSIFSVAMRLPFLIGRFGLLRGIFMTVINVLTVLGTRIPLIGGLFIGLANVLGRVLIVGLPAMLSGVVAAIGGVFAVLGSSVWGIVAVIGAAVVIIVGAIIGPKGIMGALSTLGSWIGGFFGGLGGAIMTILQPIVDAFQYVGNMIVTVFTNAFNHVIGLFSRVGDFFGGIVSSVTSQFDKLNGMFDSMMKGPDMMKMKQAELVHGMVGGYGGLPKAQLEAVIADAMKANVISSIEGFQLKQMLDLQSGLAAGQPPTEGTEGFEGAGEKDRGPAQAHPFRATTFGTEEEYKARVTGQNELVKSTDKLLAETKKQTEQGGESIAALHNIRDALGEMETTREVGLA